MAKVIFFDLFWTLIHPELTDDVETENKILGISVEEWFRISEAPEVADDRYLGKIMDAREAMKRILDIMPFPVSYEKIPSLLNARYGRIKDALLNIDSQVTDVLQKLRNDGNRLCIISNADCIDIRYWEESALKNYFDEVIFSCNEGVIKPDKKIYELAMNRMKADSSDCIYVGDGGSNELYGAKQAGMKTVLTEYFVVKKPELREKILESADYVIEEFSGLLDIIS